MQSNILDTNYLWPLLKLTIVLKINHNQKQPHRQQQKNPLQQNQHRQNLASLEKGGLITKTTLLPRTNTTKIRGQAEGSVQGVS